MRRRPAFAVAGPGRTSSSSCSPCVRLLHGLAPAARRGPLSILSPRDGPLRRLPLLRRRRDAALLHSRRPGSRSASLGCAWMPLSFIGTFGAVIRIRSPFPNRRALFDIGIAGPLAGFVALPAGARASASARRTFVPLARPRPRTAASPSASRCCSSGRSRCCVRLDAGRHDARARPPRARRLVRPARDRAQPDAGGPARRRPRDLCALRAAAPQSISRVSLVGGVAAPLVRAHAGSSGSHARCASSAAATRRRLDDVPPRRPRPRRWSALFGLAVFVVSLPAQPDPAHRGTTPGATSFRELLHITLIGSTSTATPGQRTRRSAPPAPRAPPRASPRASPSAGSGSGAPAAAAPAARARGPARGSGRRPARAARARRRPRAPAPSVAPRGQRRTRFTSAAAGG